jgi:glycosyltransferase involved in cell wall biosynthesis
LSLWAPPGVMPATVADAVNSGDKNWLRAMSGRGGIAHLLRTHPLTGVRVAVGLLRRLRAVYKAAPADIAHVNWLQNALPLWGTPTPAVVSVLGTDFGLLRLPGMRFLLRAVFRQRRTILAPNADWMVPALSEAFGDTAEIQTVAFGVDEKWFAVSRAPFADDPPEWLAVTRLTKNKIGNLFEWGDGLFGQHRVLHLFGPMQEDLALPSWVHYHGPGEPDQLCNRWFPRACGLISLSRHDEGRPQVMLEAMAASLPIIASDLPAHRNIIRSGENGLLAATRADFAAALDRLENPAENQRIGMASRHFAASAFGTWDDCAARYAGLYKKLLEKR